MRHATRAVTLALVFVCAAFVGVAAASAFPLGGSENCYPDDSISFRFDNSGAASWTTNEKTRVRDWGAHDWEIYDDSNGSQLVSNWEVSSGEQVKLLWEVMPGTTWGSTKCDKVLWEVSAHGIHFDTSFRETVGANYADLGTLATHEFGHAHGLGHTGDEDSKDGDNPPKMECHLALGLNDLWPSQDDWSALYQAHNVEYSGYDTYTANPSFENNTLDFWGYTGAYMRSGGGSDGYYFVKLTSPGDYIYQTTRFADGSDDATILQARTNARRWSTTGSGTVQVQLITGGPVYYGSATNQDCWEQLDSDSNGDDPWHAGAPLDDGESAVMRTRSTITCTPTTSWNVCDSATWVMPSSWETGDVRVKVTNYLNGVTTLYVDNIRVRGK